jgi:frataxin-like iron-binding protein CyaY
VENDDFRTEARVALAIPPDPSFLQFKLEDLNFDLTDTRGINDAFEVALLDSDGATVVHSFAVDRDTFVNFTEGETYRLASGVDYNEATQTVSLNLMGLTPTQTAELVFRLVNNDGDTASRVSITDIEFLEAPEGAVAPLTSLADSPSPAPLDSPNFNHLTDVSPTIAAIYGRTSFHDDRDLLTLDLTLANQGTYSVSGPLIVAIKNITHPSVSLRDPEGYTPEGWPYYNVTGLALDNQLDPGSTTGTGQLVFHNPEQVQFGYELVVLAALNQAPEIISDPLSPGVKVAEVLAGQTYHYDVEAVDGDGDDLHFSLVVAPQGMTIDPETGQLTWQTHDVPATDPNSHQGNHSVVVRVSDGRGGTDVQAFNLNVTPIPPNRPPLFTSDPAVDAFINQLYTYDADAVDPDQDNPLSYSLVIGPNGMTVNPETGEVRWTVPPTVLLGDTILGVAGTPGENDEFSFSGVAGQRIYFDPLTYTGAWNGWDLDIYSPSGQLVLNGVDFRWNQNRFLQLKESGNYRLVVDPQGEQTGAYGFSLIDLDLIPLVPLDTRIDGKLSPGTEDDLYRFSGTKGQKIFIDHLAKNGSADWVLYDAGYHTVAHSGNLSDLEVDLPKDGEYILAIRGSGAFTSTVDYSFEIITPDLIYQDYRLGEVISSQIGEKGERDFYTFEALAGQRLFLDGLANNSNIRITVTSPTNNVVINNHDSRNNTWVTIKESGTYRIQVDANGEVTDDYGFRLLEYGNVFAAANSQAVAIDLDTDITGTIDDPLGQESHFYKFTVRDADYVYVDTLAGDTRHDWTLWTPQGTQLSGGHLAQDQEFWLPEAGEYTLEIWGSGAIGAGRDYQLRLITPDFVSQPYTLGDVVSTQITAKGEQDFYTFGALAGQRLFLDGLANNSNIRITVTSPTEKVVINSHDSRHNTWIAVTESGTYTLQVDGNGEVTDDYSFRLLEYGNVFAGANSQAVAIDLDTDITGTLDDPFVRESHLYKFSVSDAVYLYLDTQVGDVRSGWTLWTPQGTQLTTGNLTQDQEFWLPQAGEYTLEIWGSGTGDGDQDYQLRLITPDFIDYAYTLGDAVSGQIGEKGEQQIYHFDGTDGQRLYFDILAFTGSRGNWRGHGRNPDTAATLYSPSGKQVFTQGIEFEDLGPLTLSETGAYRLVFDGVGEDTQPYTFRLLDIFANADPIELDTDIMGTLDPSSRVQFYRFEGTAGQHLYLDGLTSPSTTTWTIYDPQGRAVSSLRVDADQEITLTQAGTYAIGVRANSSVDYHFKLITPDRPEQALTLGTPIYDTIAEKGEQDTYTFTGTAGQVLYFDVLQFTGGGNNTDTVATLYDATDQVVMTRRLQDQDQGPFRLKTAGEYRLVLDGSGEETQPYGFNLLDVASATAPLALDTAFSGTLDSGRDVHFYQFEGTAGQALYLDALASPANTFWTIYDANYQVVVNLSGSQDHEITLPQDATYTLAVRGFHGEAVDYEFQLISVDPTTTPLTLGEIVAGTIAKKGEQDTYTFSGNRGQSLYFDILSHTGNSSHRTLATLYSPSNQQLFTRQFHDADPVPVRLVETGDYRLVIDGDREATEGYSFRLVDLDDSPNITAAIGTSEIATVTDPNTGNLYALTIPQTWANAQAIAQATGGTLATINNPEENTVIAQFLRDRGISTAWIGFNDVAQEGNWVWESGEPVTYTNWNSREPNNSGNEDYAQIFASSGRWNDVSVRNLPGVVEGTEASLSLPEPSTPTEISGTLVGGQATELYQITVAESQTLSLTPTVVPTNANWTLYDPSHRTVIDVLANTPREVTLANPGTYTLALRGYHSEDTDYGFTISTFDDLGLPNPDPSPPIPLDLNTIVSGSITTVGAYVDYTFEGSAGQQLFYDALASNPYFRFDLYDPTGRHIFIHDSRHDRGTNSNLTLTTDGPYRVSLGGASTGDYQFRLLDRDTASLVDLDTPITGTFDSGARGSVAHRFNLTERTYLYGDGQTGDGAWIIYGPSGALVDSAQLYQDQEFWLNAGEYMLVLQGYGIDPNYSFELVTPELDTTPIDYGEVVKGALSEPGEQDTYTFTGSFGQRLYYDALGGNLDRQVLLYDPNGTQVYSHADPRRDRGPNQNLTLTLDGTYRLTIDGNGEALGDYQFRLLDLGTAPRIELDQTVTGTFDTVDQGILGSVAYSFELTEGTYVYADGQVGDGFWRIYRPDGSWVSGERLYYDREFWLEPGAYNLVLAGDGSQADYGFQLRDATALEIGTIDAEIATGETITGTIATPGQVHHYTFNGSRGQHFFYDALGGNPFYLALINPEGETIFESADGLQDRSPHDGLSLDLDGTYTLKVGGSRFYNVGRTGPRGLSQLAWAPTNSASWT